MGAVAVWGAWHLGSVVAAGLAALDHRVLLTDLDADRRAGLREGRAPISEPGLDDLIAAQAARGTLSVHDPDDQVLAGARLSILTLDVEVDDDDVASLDGAEALVDAMGRVGAGATVLVVMSQVPVGTSHRLAERLASAAGVDRVPVAAVPENLRLGRALDAFFHPDRLVIGADGAETASVVAALFERIDCPKLHTGVRSAEMSKHALNAYLATCISFAGEISDLCERAGADAWEVVSALRSDRRVSPDAPLSPGLGYAGGTLGRDVQYLIDTGRRQGVPTELMEAVRSVNRRRLDAVVDRVARAAGTLAGARVAILGLTYKPGTDTLRRSLSLELARALAARGAQVIAHDPTVSPGWAAELGLPIATDPHAAAEGADVVVLATEWPEYRELDPARLAAGMRGRVLIDPRGFLDGEALAAAGIAREVVGKPFGEGP